MRKDSQEKIVKFGEILIKWNRKINLISAKTTPTFQESHINDGLMGAEIVLADGKISELYDLGSGNGIPGVIFACVKPDLRVFCVESDQRKASFLKTVAYEVGLSNLNVLNCRAEELSKRGVYTFSARGFGSLRETHALVDSISERGSVFYHFKSENWESELGTECSTWNISEIGEYKLFLNDQPKRKIIRAEKN